MRLLAVSALVAACSVVATAWLAVQTTSGAIREQQGRNLTDDTRIYNTLRGHAATHPRWDGVQRTVRELARTYDRRIALTTPDGRTVADSAADPDPGPGTGPGSGSGSGSALGAGEPPPELPSRPAARVDPLTSDAAFLPGGQETGGRAADPIDPRAVGPFRLPREERTVLRQTARRIVTCLTSRGVASDIVYTPSGRPRVQIVGDKTDVAENARCGLDSLAEPTRTEQKALKALNTLSDACLQRKGHRGVRLGLGLTWHTPDPAWTSLSPVTPSARPAPDEPPDPGVLRPGATVPLPAPAPLDEGGGAGAEKRRPLFLTPEDSERDRAIATCVDSSRQEQLTAHVSPPALLYIGDTDGTTVPGFDLSPRNTAKIAGVAAGVLALTVGATVIAATRLVRPLRALTGAAQRMKDGERTEPVPVTTDNEVGRLAAAFNDMAAHRARLEAQRRAMVSDVAHELRTPLSNIRGWLEGAQDGVAEPDAAFVDSLLEEAVQLQHIIDDLRDLAEADAGALRLRPVPVRPAELLGQVASAHQARADEAGTDLRVEVPHPVPVLSADPVRLRQAVGNLLSNAVRHTPRGGSVTLRAAVRGERLAIEVADTGQGIAAEDLPYVFDRFWRAEKSRSRRTGGSGLGLAIVRKLTEAHGGAVTVESEPGRGSVFTLLLPFDPPGDGAGADRADRDTTAV
ncbi:HAMP domain-containing histidine kinase [Streptomyces clavuligerus]|nr:HAMP domain-containing sensor histidine kinase [Streptomyces clavuligerus]AXU16613.1 sensor histidine kinase [Streptomyces clavuligerus]MBY6304634.1 HAMP domain-containing histidine kinase [Streptomyces clavuligerus]QCS09379.1 sensor histidine kinase [Streptomyces clavuligerus]QPJ96668.1 HAMP domain-containing protein [Streptomyces clavuligerus]QPL66652.1 HAMP domain-containing histidine kinase [Streptomyces clavuligerus]